VLRLRRASASRIFRLRQGANVVMIVASIIEIPAGSQNQYAYEGPMQGLRVDGVLAVSMHYPVNYGHILDTWSENGHPLRVVAWGSTAIYPGVQAEVRVLGVLAIVGNRGPDPLIIGVLERDPRWATVQSLDDLGVPRLNELRHFFTEVRAFSDSVTTFGEYLNVDAAVKIIAEAQARGAQRELHLNADASAARIADIRGYQIFDSRGWPTLAVEVSLVCGSQGLAMIPAGASTGSREARELRDGGPLFSGRGVSHAIEAIRAELRPRLLNFDASQHEQLERSLVLWDGTGNKSRLGSNTTLGISSAAAQAAAQAMDLPLYQYWADPAVHPVLPTSQFNVINGGVHADSGIPVQEFLVIPGGAGSFAEAMQMGTEIYHALAERLKGADYRTAVGDEGGFAPQIAEVDEAFEWLLSSIEDVGLNPGLDVALGVDVAANSLRVAHSRSSASYRWGSEQLTADQLIDRYAAWVRQYPLISIEDGLAEDD
jgi:inorganic pyrophosphatase